MAYTKKPAAEARRRELLRLTDTGCAALRAGREPTPEQLAAIRNTYRTAMRATREGVRGARVAYHMAWVQQINAARAEYAAAANAPTAAAMAQGEGRWGKFTPAQPASAPTAAAAAVAPPQLIDPFTGEPLALA